MKKRFIAVLGAALVVPAVALASADGDLAEKYFSKNNPTLSAQEMTLSPLQNGGPPAHPPA